MATIAARLDREGNQIGWQAKVRKRGFEPVSRTFGLECGTAKKARAAAVAWAADIERQMADGTYRDRQAERLGAARGEWTPATILADLMVHYRDTITPTKKGRVQEKARIDWWLKQVDGSYAQALVAMPIGEITKRQIAEWRDVQVAAGAAPSTVRNKLTIISQVFQIAANELGIDVANPVRGMRLPKARRGRERRIRDRNEEAALYAVAAGVAPWFGRMVRLAVETAMRRGELLSLTRGSLIAMNVDGALAYVLHLADTKNGEARSVPLSPEAKRIVDELIADAGDDGRLFPVSGDRVSEAWRTAVRVAKIGDLTFHDLRHEATSRLFERGFPAMEVAAITGHRTLDMLKRYTHFAAARLALKLTELSSSSQRVADERSSPINTL